MMTTTIRPALPTSNRRKRRQKSSQSPQQNYSSRVWSLSSEPCDNNFVLYSPEGVRIYTCVNPRTISNFDKLQIAIARLLSAIDADSIRDLTIVLSLPEAARSDEEEDVVTYYLADHNLHKIFWLPEDEHCLLVGHSDKCHDAFLWYQYWWHAHQFPNEVVDISEEKRVLNKLRTCVQTGNHDSHPWSSEECSQIIDAIEERRASHISTRERVEFIGLVLSSIYDHQHDELHHRRICTSREHGEIVGTVNRQSTIPPSSAWLSPLTQTVSGIAQSIYDLVARSFSYSESNPSDFTLEDPITFDGASPVEACGGFGNIYLGSHPVVGKVALKRFRPGNYMPETLKQIKAEAGLWIKLEHPRILKFLGLYKDGGSIYLVSPFAMYGSLPNYLSRFPDTNRGHLILEIAQGIEYLHRFDPPIIHGDIKANNVLVLSDHHVRICDFGLSRHVNVDTLTGLGGVGTTRWQSPELLHGEKKTFASDVYAFGITLYEVLSGKLPYDDRPHEPTVATAVCNGLRPPTEPKVGSDGMVYAIYWAEAEECWLHNPASRPSMTEVLRRLSVTEPGFFSDPEDL